MKFNNHVFVLFIIMKHVYMNTDVNLKENKKTLTLQCIH